jgi:hypothetical protein
VDLSVFAQLIGADGRRWSAARDVRRPAGSVDAGEIVVERFVIYPFLHAPPGDYTLTVGAYLPGEPGAPRLETEDRADALEVATVLLRPASIHPVSGHSMITLFAGGPALIGVDYDTGVAGQVRTFLHWSGAGAAATFQLLDEEGMALGRGTTPELADGEYATVAADVARAPSGLALIDGEVARRWNAFLAGPVPWPRPREGERYGPFGDVAVLQACGLTPAQLRTGRTATLGLVFRAARPIERDYIVSAALTGSNPDGTWAWREAYDTVPALITIPTLKWIRGSVIFDPHPVTVPADATPLVASGSMAIYDHFTQAPLPALDERLAPEVPLGTWPVETR